MKKVFFNCILQLAVICCFFLVACSKDTVTPLKLIKAEPQADTIIHSPPSALRLFFDSAPDAETSQITLSGPNGEIATMGMHTMGMNDLMIMVNQPGLTDGQYQVKWSAVSANHQQSVSSGSYTFVVEKPVSEALQ